MPSSTLCFVWFLVIHFFAVKITDMVCKICDGFIFISLDYYFQGNIVTDSDSAQLFKEGSIPQLFFSWMKNGMMSSKAAKIEISGTCYSSNFFQICDVISDTVAHIHWLLMKEMPRDFWMLFLAVLQLDMLKQAKNHHFSNTEIKERVGDGITIQDRKV